MAEDTENTSKEMAYLDVPEAARRMGVAEDVVRRYCRDGHLPGVEKDNRGRWHIPETTIEAWLHQNTTPNTLTPVSPNVPKHRWTFYLGIVLPSLITVIVIAGFSLGWKSPKKLWREWDPLLSVVKPASEGEVLILIADFDIAEGMIDTDIDGEIQRVIENAIESLELENIRVETHARSLNPNDREGAKKLGQRYGATMVIWGSDTGARITADYLNLGGAEFGTEIVQIRETENTILANPETYGTFVTSELPGELAFISFYAIAQSYVDNQDNIHALLAIDKAIDLLPVECVSTDLDEEYNEELLLYDIRTSLSIDDYSDLVTLYPQNSDSYYYRGLAYAWQGDFERAISDFNDALSISPKSPVLYFWAGEAHYLNGDPETAIFCYSMAILYDPDYADAYCFRSWAYEKLGDEVQAAADEFKCQQLRFGDTE